MRGKVLKITIAIALVLSMVSCNATNLGDEDKTNDSNGQTTQEDKNKEDNNGEDKKPEDNESEKEENITLEKMIPKTDLELYFTGTDFASEKNIIKVKGNTYQVIEQTGKGPVVRLYTVKGGTLTRVYSGDLTEEESSNPSSVDYFDKVEDNEEINLLKEPLKEKVRWDNKEIVEVGQNLKLVDLQLEGTYVKTWEKTMEEENEIVKVAYYSEGLGCVMYKVLLNNEVVEEAVLNSIVKR